MIGGLKLWLSMVHGYNYDMHFLGEQQKKGCQVCSETNGTNNKVAFDVDKLGYMEAKMGQSHLLRWRGSERERERETKMGWNEDIATLYARKLLFGRGF